MSNDISIIALILCYAFMFVFAILYLNDWKSIVNVLGLMLNKKDTEAVSSALV